VPGLDKPGKRIASVVVSNAWAKEPTNSDPRPPSQQPARWQEHSRVQPPTSTPERVGRHAKFQADHEPAGTDHPDELLKGGPWIPHVAQQVSEGKRVEACVPKRKLLTTAQNQPDAPVLGKVGDVFATTSQHGLADVDPHQVGGILSALDQLERDPGGAGSDIENRVRPGRDDLIHEALPPSSVLAKGQDLSQPVVARRQVSKQRLGEASLFVCRVLHSPHTCGANPAIGRC